MDDPPGRAEPSDPPSSGPAADQDTIPDELAGSGGAAEPPPLRTGTAWWPLRRSTRNRKVKGVAGGVAAAADLDATLVRVLFVLAAFSCWGIVAYIVLAIVLQDETDEEPARPLHHDARRNLRIGLAIAAVIAFGSLFDGWYLGFGDMGVPFLLVAVGAAVLWARRDQSPSPPLPSPVGEGALPGSPPGGPQWAAAPAPPLATGIEVRSTGRDLLRLAAAFVAIVALLALLGGAFLVVAGGVSMRLPFLPAAVALAGVIGLLVSVVRRGRVLGLLLPGGVLLVAVALAVGLASFPGTAGERVVVIGPGTPLLDRYEHSVGRLVLDLRHVTLETQGNRRVVAKVGTGQLTVIVPAVVATNVTAEVGAGNVILFGREESGPGLDLSGSQKGAEGRGRLDLDLAVGVGQLTVELAPEATYEVPCHIPAGAPVEGTSPITVTCRHPEGLAGRPMSCSVALVDPEGRTTGRAFCKAAGRGAVPKIGTFATSCEVPADTDQATCAPLDPGQLEELTARRARLAPTGPPAPASSPPTSPGVPLLCGEPDAAGYRICTPTPTSATTTTAAVSYRCQEDPVTKVPTACVPA